MRLADALQFARYERRNPQSSLSSIIPALGIKELELGRPGTKWR